MISRLAGTTELRRWTERQIVGAVLLDPQYAIPRGARWITSGDFATPALRNVFAIACDLAQEDRPVTLPAVLGEMVREGRFPKPEHGAAALLSQVVDECATAALVEENARALRRLSLEENARILHAEGIEGRLDEARAKELQAVLRELQAVST